MSDITKLINDVLLREGSTYTNDPNDRGGPTKYGIDLATLSAKLGRQATAADVEALTETAARAIYLSEYWTKPHFDVIEDQALAELVFDSGVQHGPERVTLWLQTILGMVVDGNLGDHSQQALKDCVPAHVYRVLLARRIMFYGEVITNDISRREAANAKGWMHRMSPFIIATP